MTTPAVAEAWLALTGALRLARGDPGGLTYFNPTEEGFWHSFRAAALCYPLYLLLLAFPIELGQPAQHDWPRVFTVETIHYVISWVAFPLLMLPIIDRLDRRDRYFAFLTAYNWCQVPQTVVFALVALSGIIGLLSAQGMLIADLVAGFAALLYEWYIARVALTVSRPRAALVIAANVVLATFLSHISAGLD